MVGCKRTRERHPKLSCAMAVPLEFSHQFLWVLNIAIGYLALSPQPIMCPTPSCCFSCRHLCRQGRTRCRQNPKLSCESQWLCNLPHQFLWVLNIAIDYLPSTHNPLCVPLNHFCSVLPPLSPGSNKVSTKPQIEWHYTYGLWVQGSTQ
jgi:hypothetical protein